jgi:hypothetical protein
MSLRRAAAVVLARAAAAAPSARTVTTHAKLAGKVESSGKADIFGLYAGLALSAAFVAYDQMYPEEVRGEGGVRAGSKAATRAAAQRTHAPLLTHQHPPKTPKKQQEFEGRIPYYPYMRMRQRAEFPWGKSGLFEPHPRVVPDGEEPEHH